MKPVRFIRAWQFYRVGQIITPTAAFGETLVKNNICEYVVEPEPEPKRRKRKKR